MRIRRILADMLLVLAIAIYAESLLGPIRPMIVMSRSMEPALKRGSIVIGRRVTDDTDLNPGDICTYLPDGGTYTVTHRIVDINTGGFIFKGDNNEEADEKAVKREQIRYKVRWNLTLR